MQVKRAHTNFISIIMLDLFDHRVDQRCTVFGDYMIKLDFIQSFLATGHKIYMTIEATTADERKKALGQKKTQGLVVLLNIARNC